MSLLRSLMAAFALFAAGGFHFAYASTYAAYQYDACQNATCAYGGSIAGACASLAGMVGVAHEDVENGYCVNTDNGAVFGSTGSGAFCSDGSTPVNGQCTAAPVCTAGPAPDEQWTQASSFPVSTVCSAGCTVAVGDAVCGTENGVTTCGGFGSAYTGANCTTSGASGASSSNASTGSSSAPPSPCPTGSNLGEVTINGETSVACYPTGSSSGASSSSAAPPVSTTTVQTSTSSDSSGNTVTTTTTTTNTCGASGVCSQSTSTASSNGTSGTSKGTGAATPAAGGASGGSGSGQQSCGTGSDCLVKVDETGTTAATGSELASQGAALDSAEASRESGLSTAVSSVNQSDYLTGEEGTPLTDAGTDTACSDMSFSMGSKLGTMSFGPCEVPGWVAAVNTFVSWVWVISTAFVCMGMVRRSVGGA